MSEDPQTALVRYRAQVLETNTEFVTLRTTDQDQVDGVYRYSLTDPAGRVREELEIALIERDWVPIDGRYTHNEWRPAFGLLAPPESYDIVAISGAPKSLQAAPPTSLSGLADSGAAYGGIAIAAVALGAVLMLIGVATGTFWLTAIGVVIVPSPAYLMLISMWGRMYPHYVRATQPEFQTRRATLVLVGDDDELMVEIGMRAAHEPELERLFHCELERLLSD